MAARRALVALFVPVALACGAGTDPSGSPDGTPDPPGDPRVVFAIEVPATTPEGSEIWISGDRPELGSWNGRGLRAEQTGPFVYEVVREFPRGTALAFKVTRGSWETVEKGPLGEEIGNRGFVVAGPETARVVVASWRDQVEDPDLPSTRTGDIRAHEEFPSVHVAPRDVLVYLPPAYADDPGRRYPVLYMHDGQNVFDRATSFLGIEWQVDETAERLIAAGEIAPLIIVAVDNSGAGRIGDYTPVPGSGPGGGEGGGADAYGRFLTTELLPFIDATYRTRPGREETGLAGSSLGGLVSLYLGISLDEEFGRLGVVSPSVWWADGYILDYVEAQGHRDTRIWLDMGTAEPGGAVEQARALRDVLTAEGWLLEEDLRYLEAEGAVHNEAAWADRVDDILRFLYPRR